MAENKIRISADTSDVKKSLMDLKKTIQRDMGKSNIQLFSKDTNDLLKKGATKELEKLNKEAKKLTDQINAQTKSLMRAKQGTKEYAAEYTKLLQTSKELVRLNGSKGELSNISQSGMSSSSSSSSRGSGGGLAGLAGLAGLDPIMAAAVAAALGVGGFALHQGVQGVGKYQESIGTRNLLIGRGITRPGFTGGQASEAASYGMDINAFLEEQLKSTSAFGIAGSSNRSVLQRTRFERGHGVSRGTLSNLGGGLASTIGARGANDAVSKMMSSAVSAGLKDGRVTQYLETAANMLTNINARGLSDNAQILSTLSDVVAMTKDSPEIISNILMGADASVRNASGDKAAFIQGAFARAGIGGGTILGTQQVMKTGLFGPSRTGQTAQTIKNWEKMGMFSSFKSRVSAMTDYAGAGGISARPGTPEAEAASLEIYSKLLGTDDISKIGRGREIYAKVASGEMTSAQGEKATKGLRDRTSSDYLSAIQKNTSGLLEIAIANRMSALGALGESAAPLEIKRLKAMTKADYLLAATTDKLTGPGAMKVDDGKKGYYEELNTEIKQLGVIFGAISQKLADAYKKSKVVLPPAKNTKPGNK